MGLFKTQEEKEQIAEQKVQKLLAKYGLSNLSNQEDIQSVRKIAEELVGTGLGEFGALLSGDAKEYARLNAQYSRAIVEQNFIIIRQLDRLNNK